VPGPNCRLAKDVIIDVLISITFANGPRYAYSSPMGSRLSSPRDGGSAYEVGNSSSSSSSLDAESLTEAMSTNLLRLIAYAEGSVPELQREVAEKLANAAIKTELQRKIVELGGLQLLLPLTSSADQEIQRLAAHALANLSVLAENQIKMASEGVLFSPATCLFLECIIPTILLGAFFPDKPVSSCLQLPACLFSTVVACPFQTPLPICDID
jgi:hypothetical protein